MPIYSVSSTSVLIRSMTTLRRDLNTLQAQLGTGKKADTYAGIGSERSVSLAARGKIARIDAFTASISPTKLRLELMQTSITRLDKIAAETRSNALPLGFGLQLDTQTAEQETSRTHLDEALSLLNFEMEGRYLFSGQNLNTKPVLSSAEILEGTGTQAGLRQVIDERRQADLGADSLGRLNLSTTTNTVTLAEQSSGPFGFTIGAASSSTTNMTVTGPTGSPVSLGIAFTAVPQKDDVIRLTLNAPDGTSSDIVMRASDTSPLQEGEFLIGADANTTAANFETALKEKITKVADTELTAASAFVASESFFNIADGQAPQRVNGPPFNTATALKNGTTTDTVHWYIGDTDTSSARDTATSRIDDGILVRYGARANEEGLRNVIQTLAVFSLPEYSKTDDNANERYNAFASRARTALDDPTGERTPRGIGIELAVAQSSIEAAEERHIAAKGILEQLRDDTEGVDNNEVAVQLLSAQTRLEAIYRTTATLSRLSLTQFL